MTRAQQGNRRSRGGDSRPAAARPARPAQTAVEYTGWPDGALFDYDAIPFDLAESIRVILNRDGWGGRSALPTTLAVTSSLAGEGVTTISQALAAIIAEELDLRVCWFDLASTADPDEPASHPGDTDENRDNGDGGGHDDVDDDVDDGPVDHARAADERPGLIDILAERARVDDAFLRSRNNPRLVVLSPGSVPVERRNQVIRSVELEELLGRLASEFDHVVLDVPPILSHANASALIRLADAGVLVVDHRSVSISEVRRSVDAMAPTPNLAVVINRHRPYTPRAIRRLMDR